MSDQKAGTGGEQKVYVLRLLRNEDVSGELVSKFLYCLWTDYENTWYRSVVEKCDPSTGVANLYVVGYRIMRDWLPGRAFTALGCSCPDSRRFLVVHRGAFVRDWRHLT